MYVLFFGGFIIFFDWVNFILDLNKKKKKKTRIHKNFLLRYFHACDQRTCFIRINHYLCIVGIFLCIFAQLISMIPLLISVVLLEYITLFLLCLWFYLAAYQLSRALLLHCKESNNVIVKLLFFLAFLFVILSVVAIEMYMLITYILIQ